MNLFKVYTLLFFLLISYGRQIFSIVPSDYTVSKDDIKKICAVSTIVNGPISVEMLQSYSIDDKMLEAINTFIVNFWQEFEQHRHEIVVSEKKFAYQLLAEKNAQKRLYIQKMDPTDPLVKAVALIIWGYALVTINYQICIEL